MTLWGQALQISNHSACDLSSICQCVVSVPHKINPTYFFHCNASCFVVTLYSQRTVKRLKVWSECSIHCNKWVIVTNRGRPISQLARGLICTFHSYSLQQSNNKSWVRKEPRLGLPFAVPRIDQGAKHLRQRWCNEPAAGAMYCQTEPHQFLLYSFISSCFHSKAKKHVKFDVLCQQRSSHSDVLTDLEKFGFAWGFKQQLMIERAGSSGSTSLSKTVGR